MSDLVGIFKQPYSTENVLEVYQELHEALGLQYLSGIIYPVNNLKLDVRTPLHLGIDAFMNHVKSLLHAAGEFAKPSDAKEPTLNWEEFIDTTCFYSTMTLLYHADSITPWRPTESLDEESSLNESDKALSVVFLNEFKFMITAGCMMFSTLYGRPAAESFKEVTSMWVESISKAFVTIMVVNSALKGAEK